MLVIQIGNRRLVLCPLIFEAGVASIAGHGARVSFRFSIVEEGVCHGVKGSQ